MTPNRKFLNELLDLPGVTGYESVVGRRIAEEWKPLVDTVTFSAVGSVHGHKRGTAKKPLKILLSAHMDGIGLMVKSIDGDFLRIVSVGGIDIRTLPGTLVEVHGRRKIRGYVVAPAASLMKDSFSSDDAYPMDSLLIDTGLEEKALRKVVEVGDLVSFANPPLDLTTDWITGHSLDNRASVAAVTECLRELRDVQPVWDVVAVASVQEETTLLGAATSTFEIKPDLAIAIDVTFAQGAGMTDEESQFQLGKGVPITTGPNIQPKMFDLLKKTAEELDIPWKPDFTTGMSGTDAIVIQVTEAGVPTGLLNIPLRYMHSQVEVVSWTDITRAGRLMAGFIRKLDEDSLMEFGWEDENEN